MNEVLPKWSRGGQIFFLDGFAWGLTRRLERVRIGTTEEIEKALLEGQHNKEFVNGIIKEDLMFW